MAGEKKTRPTAFRGLMPSALAEHALWAAITGASAGFFLWQLLHWRSLPRFILENRTPSGAQAEILIWASVGSVLLCGALALWFKLRGTAGSIGIASAWLRLGVPLFLVPALLLKPVWKAEPLLLMLVLVAVLGFLYWALDRLEPRGLGWWKDLPPWTWATVSMLFVLGYCVYFSYYTILNHYQLGTRAYDLGVFENTFLQTLRGEFLMNAEYGGLSFFSRHFSPVFVLWFPVYALFPGPESLLVVQSIFVALAGIPLYLLCRSMLRSDAIAALIVFCYLIHPANHGPNFYDAHEMASFSVFILALFYFFEKRWNVAFFVTLFLALSVKEDIALLMIPVAIFFALERRPRLAVATVAICVAWYLAAREIIVLSGGRGESFDFYYGELLQLPGQGATGVIQTVLTNPLFALGIVLTQERMLFVCQLLVPLLGLPLLRFRNLWLVVYGFAITLLASRPQLHDIAYQYTWYLLPMLFIGLLYTLRETRHPAGERSGRARLVNLRAALATILVASLVVSWQYGAIFARDGFVGGFGEIDFVLDDEERNRLTSLRAMVLLIPEDASVGASESLIPHIPVQDRRALWRHRDFVPDYIVIYDRDSGVLAERNLLHRYALDEKAHGILLLRRVR